MKEDFFYNHTLNYFYAKYLFPRLLLPAIQLVFINLIEVVQRFARDLKIKREIFFISILEVIPRQSNAQKILVLTYFERVFALKEAGPRRVEPIFVLNVSFLLGLVVRVLADLLIFIFDVFNFLSRDYAFGDELISVFLQY